MTQQEAPKSSRFTNEELKKIRQHLITNLEGKFNVSQDKSPVTDEMIEESLEEICQQSKLNLDKGLKASIFREVLDEVRGFGPIQSLLNDPTITEVMVNGPKQIYIERGGKLEKTDITFDDNDHVIKIIEKIVAPLGRRIDKDNPTVDARLPDGSRVNAIVPPVAIDGPSITIRKFAEEKLTIADLIKFGSITQTAANFLKLCVLGHLNVVISGGTGSGKTTLLNILSSFIPLTERIVTIEDSAELQLHQEHVVRLETKTPDINKENEVTIRDLVRNALRMRPDRIVVGEVRGGETIDMLQAMNTGHDGSLTTLHANTPRDALSRLETMAMMSGMELPVRVIREQIASAVDVIVQQSRFPDGTRKLTYITEVSGMEGDTIVMTDVFKFKQTGIAEGKVLGEIEPTGIRPLFAERLKGEGFEVGPEIFGAMFGT
ncbi:MAG: CpaF family protein [Anaerolineales bacterium]|nr:CpaF family protein [Anaerolineales bacterium]